MVVLRPGSRGTDGLLPGSTFSRLRTAAYPRHCERSRDDPGYRCAHPGYELNMTSRSRGTMRPSFASLALQNGRAQGRPGARCTRGLVCNLRIRTRTRAYRYRRSIPAFPAQWLYGLLRALPGERLFCHRRPREALASHGLNASTATSGPHDFTVRSSHTRLSQLSRPPHPTARS
jgi:hypothetical protein